MWRCLLISWIITGIIHISQEKKNWSFTPSVMLLCSILEAVHPQPTSLNGDYSRLDLSGNLDLGPPDQPPSFNGGQGGRPHNKGELCDVLGVSGGCNYNPQVFHYRLCEPGSRGAPGHG